MNDESKRPITVEDLIRLKRAERPPVEFWAEFDRELRAKQLAALVQKRAWWHQVPVIFNGLARYRLPLGATAVLAVTLVTVRQSQPLVVTGNDAGSVATVSESPSSDAVSGGGSAGSANLATIGEEAPGVYGVYEVRENESAVALTENSRSDSSTADLYGMSLLAGSSGARTTAAMTSGRLIAANLAAAQAAEPAVTRGLLGASYGFEARLVPARTTTVEPLAQMATPSEARRARLQSAMAMMTSPDAPLRTGERVVSQISDDRLYDQTHRLSGRGDRLSFKF